MNNEAVTKARLIQWLKNVLPLVKSNAFKYNKTFDFYMLNELELLTGLVTNEDDETVEIPAKEYQSLLSRDRLLSNLEAAGVDNWDGYSDCVEDEEEDNEDDTA